MSKRQLYEKILNVMTGIGYLQKDDHVKFGNTNYKAISEEKVTMSVREELIKNKLIVFPIEQHHSREGNLSTVDVKYKIVDVETGESEVIVSSGTGSDTQDKGVGKAMTYAFKYLFLRTFAIPTGEDPDKVSSAELDDKEKKSNTVSPKVLGKIKTEWAKKGFKPAALNAQIKKLHNKSLTELTEVEGQNFLKKLKESEPVAE